MIPVTLPLPPISHWVLHHRDDRPDEHFATLDEAWAVSQAEMKADLPQPYIYPVKA